jgi:hypothetical protein
VLPISSDQLLTASVAAVGVGLALSFLALDETDDPAGRFERCYATVSARVAEEAFWLMHHTRKALSGDAIEDRLHVLLWTLLFTGATLFIPVAAIYAGQRPELQSHGIAVAFGALVWGCVLESAGLPPRLRALARQPRISTRVWKVAVALVIGDLVLGASAYRHVISTDFDAAVAGAWFVGLADLVSVGLGFLVSPWEPYFFAYPDETTPGM